MTYRFHASTVLMIAAIVGAASFAAGRAMNDAPGVTSLSNAPLDSADEHEHETSEREMPPGHPPIATDDPAPLPEAGLAWTAPVRWRTKAPTSMRLASYGVPRAAGDTEDGDVSVMQAGGTVDANIDRWAGQFGDDSKQTLKRSTRKVAGLNVTIVELEGTYAGGMSDSAEKKSWALLGAIVATPSMPHFFKLTGPARTVRSARAEFDALVGSIKTR